MDESIISDVIQYCDVNKEDLLCLASQKDILLAVDESESSKRAVLYVGSFLGGATGFSVRLLQLIAIPDEDFFDSENARKQYLSDLEKASQSLLENYRKILIHFGFPENKLETKTVIKKCLSLADCIIEEQQKLGTCTIVLGREKLSDKAEFVFGSTSLTLFQKKKCSLWIIE